MNIFPVTELSESEQNAIATKLADPILVRYFHTLAYNIGRDIVTGVPAPDENQEHWLRKEIYLKGQVFMLESLLSVKPVPTNQ